ARPPFDRLRTNGFGRGHTSRRDGRLQFPLVLSLSKEPAEGGTGTGAGRGVEADCRPGGGEAEGVRALDDADFVVDDVGGLAVDAPLCVDGAALGEGAALVLADQVLVQVDAEEAVVVAGPLHVEGEVVPAADLEGA